MMTRWIKHFFLREEVDSRSSAGIIQVRNRDLEFTSADAVYACSFGKATWTHTQAELILRLKK